MVADPWYSLGTRISRWPRPRPSYLAPRTHGVSSSRSFSTNTALYAGTPAISPEKSFRNRVQEINNACPEPYPRLDVDERTVSCGEFRQRYKHLELDETAGQESVAIHGRYKPISRDVYIVLRQLGRIRSYRTAGSKLIFFDLVQDNHHVQVLCNQRLFSESGVTKEKFKEFSRLLRRGDVFCMFIFFSPSTPYQPPY